MDTRLGAGFALGVMLSFTASAKQQTYRVVSEQSEFFVHVGRAGLFKVFGHGHRIRVGAFTGSIVWDPAAPEDSAFVLEVDAGSLSVDDEELSDDEREDVQTNMETDALALLENPTIAFTSARVEAKGGDAGEHRLNVAGELTLRGVRRELEIPLTLIPTEGGGLVARGTFDLESKHWDVLQISALGGAVKTNTKLKLEFEIHAELSN